MLKSYVRRNLISACLTISILLISAGISNAQYNPIAITGFNQDGVAETGTSALSTTTMALDGVASSNKVMYSNTFRINCGISGGGIPDNGTITTASGNYQLAAYNSNNLLLLQRNQTGDLTLATPAKYTRIRVLCFSAEGTSTVNVNLTFTDGSTATGVTNYTLDDWFNGTNNLVLSGYGRCTRTTPASGFEAFPTNPRFYYIEIPISCANQQKNLQKITCSNVTTTGANAPYPNACFWAISGVTYSQTVTPAITNATCTGNNGSASLNITGSTGPYTISWNTNPVQTGTTATNLAPGNYVATITDANTCSSSFPVTIGLSNSVTQAVSKTDASCTANGSITVSASGGTGSYEYSINGGTTWQTSNTFNNVAAGNYTVLSRVTGSAICISSSTAVTISLTNNLTLVQGLDTTICNGASFTRTLVSNASNFSWSPATGVGNPAGISTSLAPTSTTTYTITASTLNCSLQRSLTVTVVSGATVNAGPDAIIIEGDRYQMRATGTAGNYTWTPAAGLSSANLLNPVASPATTTNYVLRVVTTNGCTASDNMVLTVIPYCVKPLNAFTPNGDGINDKWLITNGNCLTSASVEVFNRYGSSVYQSNDYKNDWQGTYKGENLPDGTYYYIIKYHLINGASQVLKGNVTILR